MPLMPSLTSHRKPQVDRRQVFEQPKNETVEYVEGNGQGTLVDMLPELIGEGSCQLPEKQWKRKCERYRPKHRQVDHGSSTQTTHYLASPGVSGTYTSQSF